VVLVAPNLANGDYAIVVQGSTPSHTAMLEFRIAGAFALTPTSGNKNLPGLIVAAGTTFSTLASEPVKIFVGSNPAAAATATSLLGVFTASVTVPAGTAGPVVITAVGQTSGVTRTATYTRL
jgi:hypothetical protein